MVSTLFNYQDNYAKTISHFKCFAKFQLSIRTFLSLFYKYDGDESKLGVELQKLETLVIRRMITKSETKSYNKMCKEFIKDNSAVDNRLVEQTKENIKNGLLTISNKNATLLLFWVELFRRAKDSKQSVKNSNLIILSNTFCLKNGKSIGVLLMLLIVQATLLQTERPQREKGIQKFILLVI
jgi:hypothetical protein